MKQADVKIGEHYIARIGENIVVVRVDCGRFSDFTRKYYWDATNLKTGRTVKIKSGSKLRRHVPVQHLETVRRLYHS